MDYKIILDEKDESDLLETIAIANSLTSEQYMTNIVRGWLHSQLRGKYINAAKTAPIPDLKTALASVMAKIEADTKIKEAGG